MKTMTYKVSDIRSMIQESSNEFKARLGSGVKSGNETNNGKAYKDAEKRAKDYDGGLADSIEVAKYDKTKEGDDNRTTLDYEVDNVDQKYQDRIEALGLGFNSPAEKDNGIEKQGDYEGNKNTFKAFKDDAEEWKKERKIMKKGGLTGRTAPEGFFDHDSLYKKSTNENKNVKTAYFKKTTFLTEGHMMSRIPDEFKVEENVFKMKDKTGNTYLLEWKDGKAEIIGHKNKQGMTESIERMKALAGYKASDYYKGTSASSRLNEENEAFTETLDKARKITK
jgi:hypothetical protein